MNEVNKNATYEVPHDREGQRLDNYLIPILKIPRSLLYKSLRKGYIRINSYKSKPCDRIKSNDIISVRKHLINTKPLNDSVKDQNKSIDVSWLNQYIIENNKDFIVFNKPSGLAVHGGSGTSLGLIEMARLLFKNEKFDLELVHRLDKDTSGLIILSKKRSTLRALSELFAKRNIKKTYYTVLSGSLERKQKVTYKLKTIRSKDGIRRAIVDEQEGKESYTVFTPQHKDNLRSLCKVELKTGRMHQIRAHAHALNMPILGDRLYSSSKDKLPLHLHAWKLEFSLNDKQYVFTAKIPDSWVISKIT